MWSASFVCCMYIVLFVKKHTLVVIFVAIFLMEICVKLGFVWNGFLLVMHWLQKQQSHVHCHFHTKKLSNFPIRNLHCCWNDQSHLNRNDTQEICVALIFHRNFNVASRGPETTREWCDNHTKANRHCAAPCETSENRGGLPFGVCT
jgi:hypothetical protein